MKLDALVEETQYQHSHMVSKISALLAESAGYAPDEVTLIEQAALYHDIGKNDIPRDILNKPGSLTPEEFALVKTHTAHGYNRITDAIGAMSVAAEVCREHHERQDGSGYNGLTDAEIHPYTKLIAVADVFDALYSKRAYKEAWSIPEIQEYFQAQTGVQFEPEMVTLLFSLLEKVLSLY